MSEKLSFKASASGEIAGYASVFDFTDLQGDVVKRGAFQKSIDAFSPDISRAGMKKG